MKRYANLYTRIITFENLLRAAKKSMRGKKSKNSVITFNFNLEKGIGQIKAISLPSAEYRRANFGAGWRAKRSACQEDSSKSQAKNVQVSSARMA